MTDENKNLPSKEMASQGLVDKMKSDSLDFFNPTAWEGINLMAKTFFVAGALPKSLDSTPKVIMALQAGREAGMQPMEALQAFAPINGKMTMYGNSLISQVAKAGHIITWGKCDVGSATVTIKRCDNGQEMTETYTVEDAKKSGIHKNVWLTHPRRMVKYKAFAEVANFLVPDALRGIIVREFADEYEGEIVDEKKKEKPGDIYKNEVINEPAVENVSLNEALDKEPEVEEMPEEAPKRLKADIVNDITFSATEKNIAVNEICEKYKKASLDKFTVPELLTIEEALAKSPKKNVVPNKTTEEAAPKVAEKESPMVKARRLAQEKKQNNAVEVEAEVEGEVWPDDVCRYLRFVEGIEDADLPGDIIALKVDATTGIFKGYAAYPNLKSQIKTLPADFN